MGSDSLRSLSVATWNVNSVLAHERHVLDWIEANQPGVIALQETQCSAVKFPRSGFTALGYDVVAHGRGGANGVALASRFGLSDATVGVPGAVEPFDEPRLVSANVHGIRVISAYAPNGRKVGTDAHRFKLAWFDLLRAVVDHLDETDIVVAADLNVASTDLDVWDATRYRSRNLTSPSEREAFGQLLDVGLVDVVRASLPDQQLSSWWNRRGDFFDSDRGWRLDHILASEGLAERVTGVTIDRSVRAIEGSSDHAPILVEFSPRLRAVP